jgi:ubiquinone/menaquinone biosynthesis C-methylase UbiE
VSSNTGVTVKSPLGAKKRREVAVRAHEADADLFDHEYQELNRDKFSSAFTYGRSKLDGLLKSYVCDLPEGSRILDVGCGTGEQIRVFRGLALNPVGVEPAQNMRQFAQRSNPDVPILNGTILELPLRDHSFDFVTAIEVLRYLDRVDWLPAYRELLRVLRPGGTLFITMTNRYALDGFYLYDRLRTLGLRIVGRQPRAYHEFVTPAEVRQQLIAAGAQNVTLFGRMLAVLRLAYKLHPRLGGRVARWLEPIDEVLSRQDWHVPFAGHLIVVAIRAELPAETAEAGRTRDT